MSDVTIDIEREHDGRWIVEVTAVPYVNELARVEKATVQAIRSVTVKM
ncbi:MAG TPA: hypothetical protein VGJ88_05925 [Thermoanaerobaculia bacterium]